MAQKRMFSLSVIDTDKFTEMPVSSQALYFHLGMHGDDDGFVVSPKKIARGIGCGNDDLKILISKGFILPFDSGVIVITDWAIHNTLKNDRYHETVCLTERAQIRKNSAGRWEFGTNLEPTRNQTVSALEPEHNITEHNITEHSKESAKALKKKRGQAAPRPRFVPPSVDEVKAYCTERGNSISPEAFIDFYTANGWTQGSGKKIVDWKAAVRTWERRDKEKPRQQYSDDNSWRNRARTDEEYERGAEIWNNL